MGEIKHISEILEREFGVHGTLTVSPMQAVPECHLSHSPAPLLLEKHHVIPQAWQQTWQPDGASYLRVADRYEATGDSLEAVRLWDPRTVVLAPTCHRNVHVWLVRMMQSAALLTDPEDVHKANVLTSGRHPKEREIAYEAMTRWVDAGGMIRTLIAAGQWGYA